jgi:ribonucleoside-diphosphate reductase alpha chain
MEKLTSQKIETLLDHLSEGLNLNQETYKEFKEKVKLFVEHRKNKITFESAINTIAIKASDNITKEDPDWQFLSGRLFLQLLYYEAGKNRNAEPGYSSFYNLIKILTEKGIYHKRLLESYTKEEIEELGKIIVPSLDKFFNYIGIKLLSDRYLAKDYDNNIYELPQERNMIIAMWLMIDEDKSTRLEKVKEHYWALSNRYQTVATPTLKNSGTSFGQYSSCFIDTVEDSLDGIFLGNWDVARLSKDGGGIGVYLGKIRSLGSSIKNFKGVSSGLLPWMKQLNNTAVSVDQLGQRKGAIAVYTDVWHKDIFRFLDSKLNNGDERTRVHDLSLGVCIPDLFMERVEQRGKWSLFDPHEVRQVMGWSLEDFYDEEKGNGSFRQKYIECENHPLLSRVEVDAIEVMLKILVVQKESGYPFMFYRDEVNRMNPNKHKGIIYCSNLCTEIAQNMSPTTIEQEFVQDENGDTIIVIKRKPGDFVVCNLASINLARAVTDNVLERLIPTMVRALDNVIDLNNIAVKQAQLTNKKYRAIGLGTFGWHHLLALKGIKWESEESVEYADKLYEDIAYLVIKASADLAIEKGHYPAFPGSEWNTGEYFVRRGYVKRDKNGNIVPVEGKERWYELCKQVMTTGIRNGYLMAVAPNMSTAKIGGSTDGIDPVFDRVYAEEKKDYKIITTVPDLNPHTFWFYKNGFEIDQMWSIKQNAARQKHIDQSISFNLYVRQDVKASKLLELHMEAWKSGLKTTYYVRSQSESDMEGCEACQ